MVIVSEREAAIKVLQEELRRTIQFLHDERIAGLAHLTQERVAALSSLEQRLDLEHKRLIEDLEQVSVKILDRASWRVVQLFGLILVALFIGAAVLLLLARRLFAPSQHTSS
jgi:hypothetical protein